MSTSSSYGILVTITYICGDRQSGSQNSFQFRRILHKYKILICIAVLQPDFRVHSFIFYSWRCHFWIFFTRIVVQQHKISNRTAQQRWALLMSSSWVLMLSSTHLPTHKPWAWGATANKDTHVSEHEDSNFFVDELSMSMSRHLLSWFFKKGLYDLEPNYHDEWEYEWVRGEMSTREHEYWAWSQVLMSVSLRIRVKILNEYEWAWGCCCVRE